MAYKPFGEKLNLDKDGNEVTKASFTNRGYIGHEHIQETDFINMNARLPRCKTIIKTPQNNIYLHYDSLNSVDTITNNLGVVEERMAYKPFGEKLNLDKDGNEITKASYTNRGYTGHEHIQETDFINMNARLYDPTIGRFLSADSIIPDTYDSQSFNRYSYVKNNPMKYIDPSGHWGISDIGGAISNAWKDTGKWFHTNKYKIYGVVLIVVGVIGIAFGEAFGGYYWGSGLIGTGVDMLNYNPNEPDSPSNEMRFDFGGQQGETMPVVEWGGNSQRQTEQEQYIVNNSGAGTHSTETGNKFSNGANTSSFAVTVRNNNGSVNNDLRVDKVENSINQNPNASSRILTGLGKGLSKIWSKKSNIGNDIVRGFQGLQSNFPVMYARAPWYAKGLLWHSGGIAVSPALEVGAGYAYYYPIETAITIETLDGYYGGSAPGDNYGSIVSGFENFTGIEIIPKWLKP